MSNALLKTPLRQVSSVKELLMNETARNQLAMVAAKHMNPERMMRVVANAIRTTPKLGQCEPISFLGALMQCASLGLEPNTILGHAYLIPFENKRKGVTEVQVVVGYKGLIDLARRSGHITSLSANIHYSDDELWLYEEGTEAQLRHRPGPQEGTKLHAYAIAKFKDGGHAYVVLPWSHVMKIRDGSQGYQTAVRFDKKDNPWMAYEDEMAKKTAVRALSKYLPLSIEFMDAITVDENKADYQAFALNPDAGLTIDGDTGEVDGDSETTKDKPAPAVGQMRDVTEKAKPEPEKAKPRAEEKPKQEEKASEPEPVQEQAKAEPQPTADERLQASDYWQMVLKDLGDIGADGVRDLHGESIDRLKSSDPELHALIMGQINNA